MKKYILFRIIDKLAQRRSSSSLKKIFIFGGLFVTVFIAIFVWAFLKIGSIATEKIASIQNQTLNISTAACFNKLITMMEINQWLTSPLEKNFNSIKEVCLDKQKINEKIDTVKN